MRTDHHLVSPTAKLVAHFRRYTDISYSEEVAQRIDAHAAASKLVGGDLLLHELSCWLTPFLEARYKCIGSQLKKEGFNSILELAAGISPRGFDMANDPNVTYVDTDLEEILDERKRLLEAIDAGSRCRNRKNHYYHARNLVDNAFEDWEDAVSFYEQSGFSIDRRPYYDGTYELSSVGRLKLDPERVMAMIRPREVWVMRAI